MSENRPKMTVPELIRQRLWFQYGIKIPKECDHAISEEIKDAQDRLLHEAEKLAKALDDFFPKPVFSHKELTPTDRYGSAEKALAAFEQFKKEQGL